jgi:hypothetical protein
MVILFRSSRRTTLHTSSRGSEYRYPHRELISGQRLVDGWQVRHEGSAVLGGHAERLHAASADMLKLRRKSVDHKM